MTEKGAMLTREEIEKKAITKAWADADFKQGLLKNPHQALTQIGVTIPDAIEIKVVEESAKALYLVLPVNPEGAGELTDDSLETVAGGFGCKNFRVF